MAYLRDETKKRKLGPEVADDSSVAEQARRPKHTYAKAANLNDPRFNDVAHQSQMRAQDQRAYFDSTLGDVLSQKAKRQQPAQEFSSVGISSMHTSRWAPPNQLAAN